MPDGLARLLLAVALAAGPAAGAEPAPVSASVAILHVEIPVADLDRASRFYEALLSTRGERAKVDGYDMLFLPLGKDAPGASVALVQGDVYRPGKVGPVVYLRADDLDAMIAQAQSLGAALLYPKKRMDDGRHLAEIEDSEGNRIALIEP